MLTGTQSTARARDRTRQRTAMPSASTLARKSQNQKHRALPFPSFPPATCRPMAIPRPSAALPTAANPPLTAPLAPSAMIHPPETDSPVSRPNRPQCWRVAATCVPFDRPTLLPTNTRTTTNAPMDTRQSDGTARHPALGLAVTVVLCLAPLPGPRMICHSPRKPRLHRPPPGPRSRHHLRLP